MKTKVAFIIALMVTLFTAVVYVGARPSESVTTNETANITAPEETQASINNAVSQAQFNPKTESEVEAVDIVDRNEVGVYIVQLQDPPLALYAGGIEGFPATNAEANGQQKLDATSSASVAYMDYLLVQQDISLADISSLLGRDVKAQYQYKASLNGFAIELSGAEAASVAQMPDVRYIEPEGEYELHTDHGPAWMGAEGIWDGTDVADGVGTYGAGVIVGVIDTGIDPWNPSFADMGADSIPITNPWGTGTYVGVCDPTDLSYDATFPCNDKLIGAWGYPNRNGGDPRDADGHGSHTASTAAGNFVNDTTITTPSGTYTASISGVAPHANVVMYAACCDGADLAAAKDQIVLDGVDVVNFSIGSPSPTADPWGSADAQQWLAVRAAGIYVANSAGNDGPGDDTLGAPSDIPWITSVGASSHDRTFLNSITLDDGVNGVLVLDGWSMTGPLTPSVEVVLSSAYTYLITDTGEITTTITADDIRLCATKKETGNSVFPPGTFSGEIVVCERGKYGRVEKGENVLTGGAGGYILAQPDEFGGGPGSLAPDPHVLPAVHIDYYKYQSLLAYLAAATPGSTMGTIAGTTKDIDDVYGDVMASFSSRGSNRTLPDMIVPSVTAPGRAIWAAYHQGDVDGDYTYNVIQGTSMSGPHVAGAFALLKALHPTWTPAEVQSAIMTTARDTVLNDDGVNVATPFAQGSGHVDLVAAANAGFVMDITEAEYTAADPTSGGKVRDLNTASLGNANCVGTCTWTRTFDSVADVSVDWTSTVTGVTGLALSVTPATFTLAPGGTQVVVFEADVSTIPITTTWQFGSVYFTPDVTNTVEAHLPVAVVTSNGSLPSIVEIKTRRDAGSQIAFDLETIEIPTMTLRSFGLVLPITHTFTLTQADLDPDFPDIFFQPATEFTEVNVPVGSMRFLAEIVDTTSPDLDMIVFHDANDNGIPELDDVDTDNSNATCQSASGGSFEKCDIMNPVDGRWFVAIFNYSASSNSPDPVELHTAVVSSDTGNMTVTGPTSAAQEVPFDVQVFYDESAMMAGETWYGVFDVGTDASNPGNIGVVPVDVVRYADDVTKVVDRSEVPINGLVEYTIEIQPNITGVDMVYAITDTIPTGLTYVPDSLSASLGTATESGGVITWSDSMVMPMFTYLVTDNNSDPNCGTPWGGYYDLESSRGYATDSGISGNNISWDYGVFSTDFYGMSAAPIRFTDDGAFLLNNTDYGSIATHQDMPDATSPNGLIAPYWRDMQIVYDEAANKGVTAINFGVGWLVEFDDIEPMSGGGSLDFEIFAWSEADHSAGTIDIMYAYDNVTGVTPTGTIGIENADGTAATQYAYDTVVPSDGLVVCLDSVLLGDESVTITYQATVDVGVAIDTILTNTVAHEVDNAGSAVVDVDEAVTVVGVAYGVDLSGDDAKSGANGTVMTYAVTVTNTGNIVDTYTITISDTWGATAPVTITLAAGAIDTFNVEVTIPAGVGVSDVATVTVTSETIAMEFDVTHLTTTSVINWLYLPVIMK